MKVVWAGARHEDGSYVISLPDGGSQVAVDPTTGNSIPYVTGLDCLAYDSTADSLVPKDCGDGDVGVVCKDGEGRTEGNKDMVKNLQARSIFKILYIHV